MLFIMFPTNASNKKLYTSYFPQDAGKYTGYEKILYGSGFGQLCTHYWYNDDRNESHDPVLIQKELHCVVLWST